LNQINIFDEIIVDNFAGGGGASTGIELAAGRPVAIAINHDPDAILLHKTNHPYTTHLQASVWDVDPVAVCKGRPVGLAWFSPDCKHFSKAKGAALVDRKIRGLAWIVLRWAGTVRPRVIMLENVEEFQTWGPVRRGKPIKKKAGQTFRKFIKQLSKLGYNIQFRELVAADYGAPTTRKRFVLVARCDGKPIVWPERTHAPRDSEEVLSGKLLPWRSAAEIIDWSQPTYSIFASKQEIKEKYGVNAIRPLADNTLRRIIRGVDKFTIKSGKPFLVECNHGGDGHTRTVTEPVNTVTGKYTGGVCSSVMVPYTFSNTGGSVGSDVGSPVHTIRTAGGQILSAASLIQYHTEQTENVRASGLNVPLNTVDASNRYGLTCANLVEYYGNGNPLDVSQPMHTVTAHDREALVSAHVVKFKGQELGQHPTDTLNTITAQGLEYAQCNTVLVKAGGQNLGHWPKIRDLLNKYCGYSLAGDEVLLLNISGVLYFIADITLRMLIPRELYNAMGFPVDYIIDRDYRGKSYGKTKQVERCGNAVCPPLAEAMVRANLPEWCGAKFTTMRQFENAVAV
jgi:DNA (cytosine-5)-methyltransferase 1